MDSPSPQAVVIGAGPAGLMAAQTLALGGVRVDVYDAMPSPGRKFLMAGKGGLNLTHSEPLARFLQHYGARRQELDACVRAFGPGELRAWASELGIDTFIGSSGRVFPAEMKAAPLLRKWLHRLRASGVRLHMRHRWNGWSGNGDPKFHTPLGERTVRADAIVLALGGGSWKRLGSDAGWIPLLEQRGIGVAPLKPANCGFDVGWSEHFLAKFAGDPLKSVVASFRDTGGVLHRQQGECVVTDTGLEGGLIYALSAPLRNEIESRGFAQLELDLLPGREPAQVRREVSHPRGARSFASHLQSRLGIRGVKAGLLREVLARQEWADPVRVADALKALPLRLVAARPIDEAISTAGGIRFEALDACMMLRALPGTFCAGEMLDWEAPTGGYLLTACFATGRAAGEGALDWIRRKPPAETN